MSRAEESCFRVPVRVTEGVTQYGPPSFVSRRTKRLNMSLWAPIVSAPDADAALAKVIEMYPGIGVVAAPVFLHGPGNHRAARLQESLLARVGFA